MTVPPVIILNSPEVIVSMRVFADKTPPVFIIISLVGDNVTLLSSDTFPKPPITISAPVNVPEEVTVEVESNLNSGDAIEPVFTSADPKNLIPEPVPVTVPLLVRFPYI